MRTHDLLDDVLVAGARFELAGPAAGVAPGSLGNEVAAGATRDVRAARGDYVWRGAGVPHLAAGVASRGKVNHALTLEVAVIRSLAGEF